MKMIKTGTPHKTGDVLHSANVTPEKELVAVDGKFRLVAPQVVSEFVKIVKTRKISLQSTEYTIAAAGEDEYLTRPGRVSFGHEDDARASVGRAVATRSGEWLKVAKVEFATVRSAGIAGRTWFGVGRHVSDEEAGRINARFVKSDAAAAARNAAELAKEDYL